MPSRPATPILRKVPPATVENSVVNHIYGGNILIASHAENVSQIAHTTVAVGDTAALKKALKLLGITDKGIKQLESDIEADQKNGAQPVACANSRRARRYLKISSARACSVASGSPARGRA
jgi:hypothetical protein